MADQSDLRNRMARAIAYSGDLREKREWSELLPETRNHYRKQADAALAEMGGVRVRELDWEDYPINGEPVLSMAVTPSGTYFICDDTDDFTGLYCEFISCKGATWYGTVNPFTAVISDHQHVDDLSTLKAAAQADYEARILAAIEPAPVGLFSQLTDEQKAAALSFSEDESFGPDEFRRAPVSVREAAFAEAADRVKEIVWIEGTGSARDRDVFTRAIEMASDTNRAIAEGKQT